MSCIIIIMLDKINKLFWEVDAGETQRLDVTVVAPAPIDPMADQEVTRSSKPEGEEDVDVVCNDDLESLQKQLLTSRPDIAETFAVKGKDDEWSKVKGTGTVAIGHEAAPADPKPESKHKKHKKH